MMKKFLAVVGMLSLFAVPVFAADEAAPAAAAPAAMPKKASKAGPVIAGDEEGVKKLFEDASAAWNAGDAKALAALFTLDSSLINPMGNEGHGRKEVEKVIEAELSGPMKGSQQTFSDFNIRFYPQPNIALIDCTGTVTGMKKADGTDAEPSKVHIFGIAVNRTGKKWQSLLIRAYAYLTPPGAADASAAPDAAAAPADTKKSDKKSDKK